MSDDNLLIRVASHDNGVVHPRTETEEYSFHLTQAFLETCRESPGGELLLQVLAAVDFAGSQRKPVMLLGRKQQNDRGGGFRLHVTVPLGSRLAEADQPNVHRE